MKTPAPARLARSHGPRPSREGRRAGLTVIGLSLAGSAAAGILMLLAVLGVAALCAGYVRPPAEAPPLVAGGLGDVAAVLRHNLVVLALYASSGVAAYLALRGHHPPSASPPAHRYGRWLAVALVLVAVGYSIGQQIFVLGRLLAGTSGYLNVPTRVLELGLLPHAILELTALFLPLIAAGVTIHHRDAGRLLAVTATSVAIALPMLIAAAVIEVYVSPAAYHALACTGIGGSTAAYGGCATPDPCPRLPPLEFEKRYHIQLTTAIIKRELARCRWPAEASRIAPPPRART